MAFIDFLNKPLPSTYLKEGCGNCDTKEACGNSNAREACGNSNLKEGCGSGDAREACGDKNEACGKKCGSPNYSEEGFGEEDPMLPDDMDLAWLDGMSDDELDSIVSSIGSDDLTDVGLENDGEDGEGDDNEEVSLSPEEEQEADDMMGVSATAAIIQSELSPEEKVTLSESATDIQIAINEGFLLESDAAELSRSVKPFTEATFSPKTKVKFSLADKKAQLYAIALNVSAASHGDPDYRKLQKVYKAKRILRARIAKKYHAEAVKRMNVYIQRLKKSKSGILSEIGKRLTR